MLGINSSLKALGSQIEGFDKNAGESLPLVKEINDRTRTIHQEAKNANQEHKAGLETIDSHLECVRQTTNESLPLVKDVDIRTRSVHREVKMAARENRSSFQTLGSHVDDLRNLTNHSIPLIRELEQRSQDIHSNLQLIRPSIQDSERKIESMIKSEISRPLAELQASLTALMTTKEAHLTQVQAHQSTIARTQYQLLSKPSDLRSACDTLTKEKLGFAVKQVWDVERYRLCSCGPNRQRRDILKGWRYWRLSWESYSQHSIKCPLYTITQKSQSVNVRCMLLPWYLRKMIDCTFSITSGAGGFAISPQLSVIRVVDRNRSPAFLQVDRLFEMLWLDSTKGVVNLLQDAIEDLRRIFCTGYASPFDVDHDGRTLLHVFLSEVIILLNSWWGKGGGDWELQELLVPFLSMCTTLGIGKNNMRHHVPWEITEEIMRSSCAKWSGTFDYLHVNEGWQLSDFSNFLSRHGAIKACLQFPQLLQDSDFGPVSKAILAKREAKLRELISLDYDLVEQDQFGWTPLHLSVYWPLGMEILLAAGVQYNGEFIGLSRHLIRERITPLEFAIEIKQDEAILLLLSADSVAYQRCDDLLPYAIRKNYEPSSRIVIAIIEALVQKSNRLRSLAIAHLSCRELDRLCISQKDKPIELLDAYAAPTANALKNVGIKIPEALEPSLFEPTVYHGLFSFYVPSKEVLAEFADRLWSTGFHDTEIYDENGYTPLHLACLHGQLVVACWFMSHGGDPKTVVRGHSLNAFHLLSQGINERFDLERDFVLHTRDLDTMLGAHRDVLARIAGVCGASCRDHCRCACSPEGCTPTAILLRAAAGTWCEKEVSFLSWCRLVDLSPGAIETCCLEFARVETFERLGITHVCCKISFDVVADAMPQDKIEEIQDEESEMIDQLEAWMTLYEEERAKFQGSATQFLGKWSDMLKDELDVPASFEEYWSWMVKNGWSERMPDYFSKSSRRVRHEEIEENQACMSDSRVSWE